MHILDSFDKKTLRDDIPEFAPGDTVKVHVNIIEGKTCLLYTSPSPRDVEESRMPSSA